MGDTGAYIAERATMKMPHYPSPILEQEGFFRPLPFPVAGAGSVTLGADPQSCFPTLGGAL